MTSIGERLRAGGPALAGFANLIPSPVATQALAAAGADVVMIDQEHGPIGPEPARHDRQHSRDIVLTVGSGVPFG